MNKPIFASTVAFALLAPSLLRLNAQQPNAAPSALPAPQKLPPQTGRENNYLRPGLAGSRLAPSAEQFGGGGSVSSVSSSSSVRPLVIQFTPTDANFVTDMEEDLAIMTRLLEKSLGQLRETSAVSKLGIQMTLTGSGPSIRASYTEGFGALFMIKINFPVVETNRVPQNKAAGAPSSEWEQAKRDLAGVNARSEYLIEPNPPYDPNLVSNLRKTLIEALKNAAHIRQLKPEEFVAITVFGSPVPAEFANLKITSERDEESKEPTGIIARGQNSRGGSVLTLSRGNTASRGSILTLRVKRADADAFAKGEMKPEEFESRVSTNTYLGNGYGITSLNSWAQEPLPTSSSASAR